MKKLLIACIALAYVGFGSTQAFSDPNCPHHSGSYAYSSALGSAWRTPKRTVIRSVNPVKVKPSVKTAEKLAKAKAVAASLVRASTDITTDDSVMLASVEYSEDLLVVDLESQTFSAYRGGEVLSFMTDEGKIFASGKVSSGRKGFETPLGVFAAKEMRKVYHSIKYDNAPMPHSVFFTDSGHAIHGGDVSRERASHGCIRIERKMAKLLFEQFYSVDTTIIVVRTMSELDPLLQKEKEKKSFE